MKSKIQWYLKRLSVMQPREVLHRLFEQAWVKRLHFLYLVGIYGRRYKNPDYRDYGFCTACEGQLPKLPFHYEPVEASIEKCLAGKVPALGFEWEWTGEGEEWHRSPDTGRLWPRLFFDRIDYRQGNPFGDVRVAWEPSRLQQLIELALIARTRPSDRELAIRQLTRQLESWVRANPPGCGIHYTSVMECGLRLIAVCHALDLARPHLGEVPAVWRAAAIIGSSHADLIRQRLSLHSSSGNHTIAECAGLVYAGILFPEMKGAGGWLKTGVSVLRQEAERQVLVDGGGIERAPWYHLFVLDLFGMVEELLRFKDIAVPVEITEAVGRGRRFIAVLAKSPANLPRQGDADGGYALSRHLRLSWNSPVEWEPVVTFADYGLTHVAAGRTGLFRLLLDHGPLGMAPSYGHGHADALSLTMTIGGQEMLVDTGTFSYTGDPEWRSYFRSTRAHNTVCVDGLDQAEQATPFQWSKPYIAELVKSHVAEDGTVYLQTRHNGYSRLGVEHLRFLIVVPDKLIIVCDRIEGEGRHKLDLYWHLAGRPVIVEKGLRFDDFDHPVLMNLQGGELSIHSGEIDPICGWQSDQYGVRQPLTTLRQSYYGDLPHGMTTIISLDGTDIADSVVKQYVEVVRLSLQ